MRVLLFGASELGKNYLQYIPETFQVVAFVDNDVNKQGRLFCDYPVYSITQISQLQFEKIIISSTYVNEIKNQLMHAGYEKLILDIPVKDKVSFYQIKSDNDCLLKNCQSSIKKNGSILYNFSVFTSIVQVLDKYHKSDQSGKLEHILHIGSGQFLGVDILLALMGRVSKVTIIEPFINLFVVDVCLTEILKFISIFKQIGFQNHDLIDDFTKNKVSVRWLTENRFLINDCEFNIKSNASFSDTGLEDESVDFIYSNAVIEHIQEPMQGIHESYRVLKPGAVSFHQVDFRDHRNFDRPIDFLKYTDKQWQEMLNSGATFVNRWRYNDIVNSFASCGFTLAEKEINDSIDNYKYILSKELIADKFLQYSDADISVLGAQFIALK